MRSWEEAFKSGRCNEVQTRWWKPKPVEELYDTENDPWEVNNLADDPAYAERLVAMRNACLEKGRSIMDAGFIPEADRIIRTGDIPAYDYMRSGMVPYEEIVDAAVGASEANPENLEILIGWLDHDDSAIRFWAAQGLLLLGEAVRPYLDEIHMAASDLSWNVSVTGAEILYLLGEKESAKEAYYRVLMGDSPMARTHALTSIDQVEGTPEEFLEGCITVLGNYERLGREYDTRAVKWLLEKWKVDPAELQVDFTW